MNQTFGQLQRRRVPLGIPGTAIAPLDYGESWYEWASNAYQSGAAAAGLSLVTIKTEDIPLDYRRAPVDDYEAYSQAVWYYATAARLADYYGHKALQSELLRLRAEAQQGRVTLMASPRRLLGFGPKSKRVQILNDAQTAIWPLTAMAPMAGANSLLGQISRNLAEPVKQARTRKWLLIAAVLGIGGLLISAAGGGGYWWTKRRRNPKMKLLERAVRFGVGGTVASIGAIGWLGPQAAEPFSTVAGGAATIGGLGLMATGLTGQAGLGKKLMKEIKG